MMASVEVKGGVGKSIRDAGRVVRHCNEKVPSTGMLKCQQAYVGAEITVAQVGGVTIAVQGCHN